MMSKYPLARLVIARGQEIEGNTSTKVNGTHDIDYDKTDFADQIMYQILCYIRCDHAFISNING